MSLKGEDALVMAMGYVDETLKGEGALKGNDGADGFSPTIVPNANNTETDYRLDITTKEESYTTENLRGMQGERGEQGEPAPNLIVTENEDNEEEIYKLDLNNGKEIFTTENLIGKQGIQGDKGFSPTVVLNADSTDDVYKLDITTDGGAFTTPNLKGAKGEKGDKGEPGESAVSAINPRGDYSADADPTYTQNDYVTYTDGNTYVCKIDNPTNEPPVDGSVDDTYWQIIALRGGKGERGEQGQDGADGEKGTTFTPHVDTDGNMTWTNDGGLENPAPINVKAYEPKIGTVETLESTEKASASVENDESTKKSTFNFSIPKGVGVKSIVFKTTTDASGESGKSGATDTYEITYTDRSTSEYSVYNGKDGVIIDDTITSAETVWSSEQTAKEIANPISSLLLPTSLFGNDLDGIPAYIGLNKTAKTTVATGTVANVPTVLLGTWFEVDTTTFSSSGYATQTAKALNPKNRIFFRECEAGKWSDWSELATIT